MTRVLGAERVPAGFTITTEACVAYLRDGAAARRGSRRRSTRRSNGSSEPPASGSATAAIRCWSRSARAPASRCRGCSTRCSTSASATRRSRARERQTADAALRLGLLPPPAADVRQRRPRPAVERLRGRAGRGPRRRRARASTPSSTPSDLETPLRALQGDHRRRGEPVPAGPARAAARGDRRRVRVLERRARPRLPPARAHSRRLGHGGQRAADGLRQPRADLGLGGRLLAQRDHRRARALRRLPRQLPGRGRGRRDPQHRGTRRPRATGCPRCTPSCSRCSRRSSATTATCRTSSSRSRTASCSCSRRGPPSAPPRPRCASPATRSPRGCSTARQAIATIDADALEALLHPTFDPDGEYSRARPRRPGLARRRPGRDRLHRGRGRAPRRRRRGRDPRPPLHRGRGRRRLSRRARHPHRRGRQVLARGAGRPRDGQARALPAPRRSTIDAAAGSR